MSLRDDASPVSAAGSPTTTTVTAAACAALTAAANPDADVQLGSASPFGEPFGIGGVAATQPGA